jgi:diguanylate cyclase (GGDEF)-like protein
LTKCQFIEHSKVEAYTDCMELEPNKLVSEAIDILRNFLVIVLIVLGYRVIRKDTEELPLQKRSKILFYIAIFGYILEKLLEFFEYFIELGWVEIIKDASEAIFLTFILLGILVWDKARIQRLNFFQESANFDNLTKLYNYGYFKKAAERRLSMVNELGSSAALIFLDIDNFKSYNDTYGHESGNLVLRQVAKVLDESVRADDLLARYGGEEFVIFFFTKVENVANFAERIRKNIMDLCNPKTTPFLRRQVTVSIGVTIVRKDHKNFTDLIKDADSQMYIAKNNGRNQVSIA